MSRTDSRNATGVCYGLVRYNSVLNPSNIRNRDHPPRLERLKLPRVRLHDLRLAHATYLVAAGVDHRTVADRLGHASPSFTLATYAHAAAAAQQRAAVIATELLTDLAGRRDEALSENPPML